VIGLSQRPPLESTLHSQETDIYSLGGIGTHNLSVRAAADLLFTPCEDKCLPILIVRIVYNQFT